MEQSNKTATDWSSYSVYECDQTHTNAARAKYPPYPTTSIIPKTIEVNGEEIAILLFVLLLWAGAISLFYHQWGKIRGLDDYQPDFVHANMTLHHNPLPEEGSEVAPSVILSPKLESPKSISIVANRLGYGRQGRRASRSLVDLAALATFHHRNYGGYTPFRRSHGLYQAKRSTKSVDEESSVDLDTSRPRLFDNARYKHMRIPECQSFDRELYSGHQQRSFSPEHSSHATNVPLTRGYLAAANRNLAASTLKLWQSGGSGDSSGKSAAAGRKTKSSYNLNDDCEEV